MVGRFWGPVGTRFTVEWYHKPPTLVLKSLSLGTKISNVDSTSARQNAALSRKRLSGDAASSWTPHLYARLRSSGTQFPCFTGTTVLALLVQKSSVFMDCSCICKAAILRYSLSLLYWYKSTNTDTCSRPVVALSVAK